MLSSYYVQYVITVHIKGTKTIIVGPTFQYSNNNKKKRYNQIGQLLHVV